jgi:hypothetical protein
MGVKRTRRLHCEMSAYDPKRTSSGRIEWGTLWATQFRDAPYRLRTATHRLPISSCGAAAKVAPHFHKAAAVTCWGRSHIRIAAYLHGIRSFRVFFRSNAVAVSPLVMHISATTVNDRIMRAPLALPGPPAFCSLDLTAAARVSNLWLCQMSSPHIPIPGVAAPAKSLHSPLCALRGCSWWDAL